MFGSTGDGCSGVGVDDASRSMGAVRRRAVVGSGKLSKYGRSVGGCALGPVAAVTTSSIPFSPLLGAIVAILREVCARRDRLTFGLGRHDVSKRGFIGALAPGGAPV